MVCRPLWGATAWSAEQLAAAGLLELPSRWPLSERLTLPGLPTVLIAHGTPDHYREGLSDRMPQQRVQAIAAAAGASILVGSHIHRPVQATVGGVQVLNTGAVGVSADGDPRAAYLLLEAGVTGEWQATLRRVDYDRAAVLRRFETSGYLAAGLSAEIFRAELQTARSLYTPYWEWTASEGLGRTRATWEAFLQQT
ncbi:metallophosphoesterase family protein [Deinococcus lacus]|uniref:Metallophosphoesterase family protein n=1 Tax=Deinococcus lacus TaxID=392561 RepID=A0ABW1Y8L9_9DEIO